jgi:SET domain-containing protein
MPYVSGCQVFRSSIHGYGLRATRAFAEGEAIADVDGVALRTSDVIDDEYCLWINDDMYLDMVDQTRWINHSCFPNAHIEGDEEPDGRVWARVVASRAIAAGEEITYDYAFAIDHAIPCRCAQSSCRRWIVDPDQLAELLKRVAARGDEGEHTMPEVTAAHWGAP